MRWRAGSGALPSPADAMPAGCAKMRDQIGVIWMGFGCPQKVCISPIGNIPIGTPLVVCPMDGICYSLRETVAHLLRTFRAP